MSNSYLCVLSFLKKYSGNQYKKLEKCSSEERTYMIDGSEAGKTARSAFASLVEMIETKYGFEHNHITQWQNSGTFVSYFWCQMKRPQNKESQISISLFAEKVNDIFRFRLSVELAMEKAMQEDLSAYGRLLEIPLVQPLVYISGGNNESEFRSLTERDNSIVKNMGLKRVQVSYVFNDKQYTSDDSLEKELLAAMRLLVPYYDYLFENKKEEPMNQQDDREEDEALMSISTKDVIAQIKDYIAARGFSYPDGLIENFYLSLKSKPFVILAGISGTGKTRLVKLFAEAVGANTSNGHYKMVSVRPDWSDSSDLFGHVDLNGKFIPGAIIDFVKRAELDRTHPYFLCLDEMNLARVEYYLSDFLSVIETRDFQSEHVVSEPLVSDTYYGSDATAAGRYGIVPFPENLYVIGTVNMDETTFPFSRKVLDRANTIEFSFVDLMPPAESADSFPIPLDLDNDFLKSEYLLLTQCMDQQEAVNSYCLELQKLNSILQKANAHVGYRVRDEIVFYLLNNKKADLLPKNEAIDYEIMQKILPRIQGSSASIKNMLCELFRVCAGDYEGQNTESDLGSKMMKAAQKPDCKYAKSAQKIAFMVRRFEEDGFTSYWL